MEYCSLGSLYGILNNKEIEFSWKALFKFAIEMVSAIHQLHTNDPVIVHRDLKSMNFLVSRKKFDKKKSWIYCMHCTTKLGDTRLDHESL